MSDPKAAVQKVRDAHKAFFNNVLLMNNMRGADYAAAKARDEPLWRAFQSAKDDLRTTVTETYGVNFYDLGELIRG